jgi:arylsulfatase A-like enzyme
METMRFPACAGNDRGIAALLLISALVINTLAQPLKKPNVLLIYTDDVGYGDIGANGGLIPTPNLDKMAEEGLNFTDMHTTSATCTPSRFGMLTGEYPWRYPGTGIASPTAPLKIDQDMYTLPDMFKAAGYATGVVGKWHLGIGTDDNQKFAGEVKPGPLELGFDESFLIPATGDRVPCVYLEGHYVVNADPNDPITIGGREVLNLPVTQYPVGLDDPSAETLYDGNDSHSRTVINGVGRIGYMAGGETALWSDEDMADDLVARAEKFIIDHKDSSFFLYFSTHDIHVPRIPHPRFRGVSGQSWRGDAMVQLDWCVGALRTILEENGLDSSTIMIFSSDNGPVLNDGYSDHAVDSLGNHEPSGVFREGKYSVYEGGTRVPGIVWWPGRITPGESDALMCQIDFLASFAHYLNVDMPEGSAKDSENHWSALMGHTQIGKELLVEATNNGATGIRVGPLKMLLNRNELYNLDNDIGEGTNIYGSSQAAVDSLRALFAAIDAGTYVPPEPVIVGCLDSAYEEYDSRANVSDDNLCVTLGTGDRHPVTGEGAITFQSTARQLTINADAPFTVNLFNVNGAAVWHEKGKESRTFTLNTLPGAGIYTVRLHMHNGILVKKIVIVE